MTWAKRFLACAGLALLAGCGNDPNAGSGFKVAKNTFVELTKSKKGGQTAEQQIAADPAALISRALKSIKGPAMLVLLRGGSQVAALGEFQRNGAYQTFTTTERQTITLKSGVLTGSRGLGYDLMSSDADASIRLIRARQPGTATRIYRFLDGEHQERPLRMTCKIIRDGTQAVPTPTAGQVNTVKMGETCRSGGLKIVNIYFVASDGFIWQSRQWVSPKTGDMAVQHLRR